jgi:hypothetical protein
LAGSVDAMIAAGVIPANQKQAALDKLASHAGALDVLGNLADAHKKLRAAKQAAEKRAAAVVASPGSLVPSPTAQRAASPTYRHIGAPVGLGQSDSATEALRRGLGV